MNPDGCLWPDCYHSRGTALKQAAGLCAVTWKQLYREGYRCIRVTVIPSTATWLDALEAAIPNA